MICQMCGLREGTVHLLELNNGQQKSIWLCSVCAAGRAEISLADLMQGTDGDEIEMADESTGLAGYWRLIQEPTESVKSLLPCPACGYEIKMFQTNNRLGCPSCYVHFKSQILPILTRYHRHASHLGKVPSQAGGAASQHGKITRLRVALEKAIQGENYEEAARLRDLMRALIEAGEDQPGNGAGQEPS